MPISIEVARLCRSHASLVHGSMEYSMLVRPGDAEATRVSANVADEVEEFWFLPKLLVMKCREFILRYHDLHGYSGLADILWQPQTLAFIDRHTNLKRLFKKAARSRSAVQAKENLVFIATVVLANEILASGFSDWESRYPDARNRARDLLAKNALDSRAVLIERYLYAQSDRDLSIAAAFAASPVCGEKIPSVNK